MPFCSIRFAEFECVHRGLIICFSEKEKWEYFFLENPKILIRFCDLNFVQKDWGHFFRVMIINLDDFWFGQNKTF